MDELEDIALLRKRALDSRSRLVRTKVTFLNDMHDYLVLNCLYVLKRFVNFVLIIQ